MKIKTHKQLTRAAMMLCSSLAFSLGLSNQEAQAATQTSFDFSGNCIDCASAAGRNTFPITATLTLSDYQAGDDLQDSNFVSFVYGGSNLIPAYSVTLSGNDNNARTQDFVFSSLSGGLENRLGSYDVELFFQASGAFEDFFNIFYFSTRADGTWDTCTPASQNGGTPCIFLIGEDFGNNGVWNPANAAVPAPASALLLGTGLVFASRRPKVAKATKAAKAAIAA